jgi:acyl-CoA dehydrogenase
MPKPVLTELPFFETAHDALGEKLEAWVATALPSRIHAGNVDELCRAHVRALGEAGWLRYCVPAAYGGALEQIDSRSFCLIRQTLAKADGLADFAFAMQGLGSGPIGLFGDHDLKQRYLPDVAAGRKIAAFALTESDAGSDAAAMATTAVRDGDVYRITGTKTLISNAGLADFYCVFTRTENDTSNGVSAFVIDAETPGLSVCERIETCAPHPMGVVRLENCSVSSRQRLGEPGQGFKVALGTLDVFRASVGAAALGFAEAAQELALARSTERRMFGSRLADLQLTRAALGDMSTDIDASTLPVYRAAWERDVLKRRTTRSAAMAKLFATESAQHVIDRALQLHGGAGVRVGQLIESLYREIRALRIYEGASEVQRLILGKEELQRFEAAPKLP